ncbi:hypothetical protein NLG97_g5471 [Lecanicillium saksenae]|uniref:Uncharacterized protein n=1 Tax=Lecanicillium saksenae TaxID=468837 RepID=A0ACC1QSJ0_9HYPO|nr:hypothetical protein NLG97_g5471 [Lecanicillium saksenae]
MPSAAQQNYVQSVVRGLPKDWSKEILRRVRAVTREEIKAAMTDVILPCFAPGKSNVTITCAKIMTENMEASIKAMGYKVQTRELSDFHDDYGLEAPEGDEDEDEDDEDDDEDDGDDEDGSEYDDDDESDEE